MPSRSLFARTFLPVPTYIFDKGILFLAFFASFSFIIGKFYVYLHPQSERKQALGRLRITTSKQKRAKQTSKERRALVRRRFYDLFGFVVNL